MITDEKIILIDIHILTEKTRKTRETTCTVQRPVYNVTNNLNRVKIEVCSRTSCQWSFNFFLTSRHFIVLILKQSL